MKIKELFGKNEVEEEEIDFEKIEYKSKEFRIYKWEKEIGEFKIPNSFRLATHSEFVELFDKKLIDYPQEGWRVYIVQHYSKRKREEGYLSSCYLYGDSDLNSDNSDLADSSGDGRVVVVEDLKND